MIKFISTVMLWALSACSFAGELTLMATQSQKINFDENGSRYSLSINLPLDIESENETLESIFDGAIETIKHQLVKDHPDNIVKAFGDIQKGNSWAHPINESVEPRPIIFVSRFNKIVTVTFSESSKYHANPTVLTQDIEVVLRDYFNKKEGVEVWRTGFKHPVSFIPQMNPFEYSPIGNHDRFGDLSPNQKKVYMTAYKKIFSELKNELEEKCRIVGSGSNPCDINVSDLTVSDRLLESTPEKNYFLEITVTAKW